MTQLTLNTGASANDGTGDTLLVAGTKINSNFTELYTQLALLTTYSLPTASTSVLGGVKVDGTSIVIANGVISSTSVGTGNVIGPATATDNAITRFDATTGKLLQNSLVTISDLGAIVAPIASSIIPFHYDNQAGFPSATTYHGAIAHSHADGKMYFAHSSAWLALANASDVPAAQVQTDWNAVSGLGVVLNKPTIPAAQVQSDWTAVSGLGVVLNKPTIPAAQVQSDWTAVSGLGVVLNKPTIPSSLSTLSGVTITSPSAGQVLKYNGSIWINDADAVSGGAGVGTVTTVSVVSANGFTGTVATASSTPAITITTSITGVLKGNGTAIAAATSGVDYAPGTSALATGIVKSTTTTGSLTIAVAGTDYQAPIGTISGIVKGNGANALIAAVAGTDYQTAQSVTGIVKSSGTARSAATSGTDYAPGTSALSTGIVKSTTTTGALSIAVSGTDYQAPIGTIIGIVKGNGANALIAAIAGTDYQAPLPTQSGQTGKYLTTDGTVLSWATVSSGSSGTVTTVSVVSANGFTGTVATSTTTPAITITTSITGVLKGNGTAISAATSGTDYQAPVSATGILKSSGVSGNVSAAVAGTDYQAPVSATGILKSSGVSGNVSAAVAGTDYQVPITFTTTGSSGAATFNGTALNIPQYASGATAFTGLSDASSASLTVDKFYLPATTKLTVTASGSSAYLFDQYTGNNPTIYAISGTTIAFDLGTGALSSHPFLIRFSGANYNTGLTHVTNAGVVTTGSSAQGKTSGTLYWKIPSDISGAYGYLCSAHGTMIGQIIISAALVARNSTNATTSSLANNAASNITITGWKSYMLLSIQTSAAAWVTVYTSSAARSADSSRAITTDPTPGSGVLAEIITTGSQTQLFSPAVLGFSDESSPSTDIQVKVVNRSGSTTTITVTMKLVQLEV